MQVPYKPIRTEQELEKIFKKMYKARYNRFTWYRLYVPKNEPLCDRVVIERRVENGDFDYSHYIYQAELVEYKLNKAYERLFPDIARYNDEHAVDILRRNKLMELYNKDEDKKLHKLKKDCSIRFKVSEDIIEKEMEEFQGNAKKFIKHLTKKYLK